jgi:hypothetical protein
MSLMDKILTLNTTRPTEQQLIAPRTYRRRATWIPVEGEKVTVWRMTRYDLDRQLEFAGVYISGDDDSYRVQIVGEETVSTFNKRDGYGATLWHLDHRGTHELEMKK